MKLKLILATVATALMATPALASPTPETITYTNRVIATTPPVDYICTRKTGQTYVQRRFYINATDYISNYEYDTVSCTRINYTR